MMKSLICRRWWDDYFLEDDGTIVLLKNNGTIVLLNYDGTIVLLKMIGKFFVEEWWYDDIWMKNDENNCFVEVETIVML